MKKPDSATLPECGHGALCSAFQRLIPAFLAMLLLSPSASVAGDDGRGEARERVEPDGFLYGIGMTVDGEIYRDYDQRVTFIPVIGYRGDRLTVFGPFVRYALSRSGAFEISILAEPRFDGFDESDSDVFEGMDDRELSMDLGVGLEYAKDNWKFELAGLRDILGRSDGSELRVGLSRVFRNGPLFIEPGIEVSYLDRRHVDYYFGVGADEVNAFRPRYEGDDAVNKSLGVSFATPLLFDGLTRFGFEYSWYDRNIADSPLTDEDASVGFFLAYSRFF